MVKIITEERNRFWLINSKVETWLFTIASTARFANDHMAPIALEALTVIQPILKYIGICDRICRIQNKNFELEIYLNSIFLVPIEYAVGEYEEDSLPIITVRE
jgi:hypothetical protein